MLLETQGLESAHSAAPEITNDIFSPDNLAEATAFYNENGYVVIRELTPFRTCTTVMRQFDLRIRYSKTPMLRQKNMQYETNRMNRYGQLTNPIFNLQDLQTNDHGPFRDAVLDMLTSPFVRECASALVGAKDVQMIQSMFFEAPANTWPHQDSYYQDSATQLGRCVAGWFALEDIEEDAGRFYVCPKSHRSIEVVRNEGDLNFADGHERYKRFLQKRIDDGELRAHAPALKKGDVLFWNSLTVHGSFSGREGLASRRSVTAHYLPADDQMLQFHKRIRRQETILWNNMSIGRLHPQDKLRNQLVRYVAHRHPALYRAARKTFLKLLLR